MKILGFEIRKSKEEEDIPYSFATPSGDDGAVEVGKAYGGAYSSVIDLNGQVKDETDLINRYRTASMQPELAMAIDEIVNEAISVDTDEEVVALNLDKVQATPKIKKIIADEFKTIKKLLRFTQNSYEIFHRFYVDGRLNYSIVIDKNDTKRGILELRYLDPRKIRLIREYKDVKIEGTEVETKVVSDEYFIYFENGMDSPDAKTSIDGSGIMATWANDTDTRTGVKVAKDSIIRVVSGLMDPNNRMVLSYIDKAIRPLNQVRMLEDATLIYTLVRAPQRRAFYVDVGNLPRAKADQYLFEMMNRHKNKVAYDAQSGRVSDDRNILSMTEDYWFPRREGNRSTEVDTLDGGAQITDSENLNFFKRNLYKSLHVPVSRLEPENMYSFGRTNEITREEVKFSKFIRRQRNKFSNLFRDALKKQLILKNVITADEWENIVDDIRFDYNQDNFFEELKEIEIMKERVEYARTMEDGIGRYFSIDYVRRRALRMTDEEIKEQDEKIAEEKKKGLIPDETQGFGGGDDRPIDFDDEPPRRQPPSKSPDDEDEDDTIEKKITKTTTRTSDGSTVTQKSSSSQQSSQQ